MLKHEIAGAKIHMAMRKVPESFIPKIIGFLLRQYNRHGLADLVEVGWDWKPKGENQ